MFCFLGCGFLEGRAFFLEFIVYGRGRSLEKGFREFYIEFEFVGKERFNFYFY